MPEKHYFHTGKFVVMLVGAGAAILVIAAALMFSLKDDGGPDIQPMPWEELSAEEDGMKEETGETEVLQQYIVDIKGAVVNPGIYTVNEGDRVHDALQLAGGMTADAEDRAVNLAERCYDEMVIYVPSADEEQAVLPASAAAPGNDGPMRVNGASVEELTSLPGIGPAKAAAIISYREDHGPFEKTEDLLNVSGIGEKTLEAIADQIIIP